MMLLRDIFRTDRCTSDRPNKQLNLKFVFVNSRDGKIKALCNSLGEKRLKIKFKKLSSTFSSLLDSFLFGLRRASLRGESCDYLMITVA